MNSHARELLLDSEVVLRLVDEAVEDELLSLEQEEAFGPPCLRLVQTRPRVQAGASDAMWRASTEATDALRVLRRARGALDIATVLVPWPVAGKLGVTVGLLDDLERRLEQLVGLLGEGAGTAGAASPEEVPGHAVHASAAGRAREKQTLFVTSVQAS